MTQVILTRTSRFGYKAEIDTEDPYSGYAEKWGPRARQRAINAARRELARRQQHETFQQQQERLDI